MATRDYLNLRGGTEIAALVEDLRRAVALYNESQQLAIRSTGDTVARKMAYMEAVKKFGPQAEAAGVRLFGEVITLPVDQRDQGTFTLSPSGAVWREIARRDRDIVVARDQMYTGRDYTEMFFAMEKAKAIVLTVSRGRYTGGLTGGSTATMSDELIRAYREQPTPVQDAMIELRETLIGGIDGAQRAYHFLAGEEQAKINASLVGKAQAARKQLDPVLRDVVAALREAAGVFGISNPPDPSEQGRSYYLFQLAGGRALRITDNPIDGIELAPATWGVIYHGGGATVTE